MGDRAATPLPERMLMELLADPLGFKGIFTDEEWFHHLECAANQIVAGKDAPNSGQTGIRHHCDERMHTIVRPYLGAPAPFGRFSTQSHGPYLTNVHWACPSF